MSGNISLIVLLLLWSACQQKQSAISFTQKATTNTAEKPATQLKLSLINTKNTSPAQLIRFAETLIGIPYLYASTDPLKGFDCSGFITYVFNHFDIAVPRSSADFEFTGPAVNLTESKAGDLILFTGTDSTKRTIGHMGIIVSNHTQQIKFIHSTSGKANGVTITPLNTYYMGRFVKVIRIFKS